MDCNFPPTGQNFPLDVIVKKILPLMYSCLLVSFRGVSFRGQALLSRRFLILSMYTGSSCLDVSWNGPPRYTVKYPPKRIKDAAAQPGKVPRYARIAFCCSSLGGNLSSDQKLVGLMISCWSCNNPKGQVLVWLSTQLFVYKLSLLQVAHQYNLLTPSNKRDRPITFASGRTS